MSIKDDVRKMKSAAPYLAASSIEERNNALKLIADSLKANADRIFAANREDTDRAEENDISQAVMKRLKFTEGKLNDCLKGIDQLISLKDPLGKTTLLRELDEGLTLKRITCPIGVIGVIFEARPDALVQISTLCIKSGTAQSLREEKKPRVQIRFFLISYMKLS